MRSMKIPLLSFTVTIIILIGTAATVQADETRAEAFSPFFVNLKVDIPVTFISTLVAVSVRYLEGNLPRAHISKLNSSSVNAMDRSVIGYHYPGWGTAGHVGTIVIPAATLCLSLIELPQFGWHGVLEDFLIVGESLAMSAMLNQIVAGSMPRPRPYMYRAANWYKQANNSSWDWRSFYSGHAGSCFAVTTAFSYIFMNRYPKSKWVPAVWVISMAASSVVSIARPLAGEHFWSDTLVGAAIGCAWGILIPVLHQKKTVKEKGDVDVSFSLNTLSLTCYF